MRTFVNTKGPAKVAAKPGGSKFPVSPALSPGPQNLGAKVL
jgi:hypothetical protein